MQLSGKKSNKGKLAQTKAPQAMLALLDNTTKTKASELPKVLQATLRMLEKSLDTA